MDYEKIFHEETPTNHKKTWAYYKIGSSGSFATALCHAYELADFNNKRRMELAFPRLFNTARSWMCSERPEEFLKEILEGK